MVTVHTLSDGVWVDLEAPTHDEVRRVLEEHSIDPALERDISTPVPYPRVITGTDSLLLALQIPDVTQNWRGGITTHELDLMVSTRALVTVRLTTLTPLSMLHRILETQALMEKTPSLTRGILMRHFLHEFYASLYDATERTSKILDTVEEAIFSYRERETVRAISEVSRTLLKLEAVIERNEKPLVAFLDACTAPTLLTSEFEKEAARTKEEHQHVKERVHAYQAMTRELQTTNDSLLSASQNHATKMFTLMAFCTFPLAVIAALFAMDTTYKPPFIGLPYDFWIIIGIMVLVDVAFLIFFKVKKWL